MELLGKFILLAALETKRQTVNCIIQIILLLLGLFKSSTAELVEYACNQ